MTFQSKTNKLITKLIRLTNDDKLEWGIKDPPYSIARGTDDVIPLFFEAKYKDKWVAVYQKRYQEFYPDTETFYWTEKIVLAVLDDQDRVLWESSMHSPGLVDLFNTVREKSAGIDELLDDLLDDEI